VATMIGYPFSSRSSKKGTSSTADEEAPLLDESYQRCRIFEEVCTLPFTESNRNHVLFWLKNMADHMIDR
jgi:hypothetical protein